MKQITQNVRKGKIEMKTVPLPSVGTGEVLVATKASLISAGTERMVMEFASKSLVGKAKSRPDLVAKTMGKLKRDGLAATLQSVFGRLDEPLPLGYSAAGTVMAVGASVAHLYAVGDSVAMAGAGLANHAQVNAVPKNLTAKMPEGVLFEHACYATLAAIALQGVRNAGVALGDRVLVMGLGLVGQLAVQIAAAAGAQVAGFDPNRQRGDLAVQGGAILAASGAAAADAAFAEFTGGRGFDSVLICAATDSDGPIAQAAAWARDRATVVLVGKVGTAFPYADFMKKELTVKTSRSYGPGRYDPAFEQQGVAYPAGYVPHTEADHLREVLELMAAGTLDVGLLTSHMFEFGDALKAYEMIAKGGDTLGVVLAYPELQAEQPYTSVALRRDELGVSLLGPGAFARGTLLPLLKKTDGVALAGIAGKGGLTAAHAMEKFEATFAATGENALLEDANTHAVVISTRHSAHAAQVVSALKAGKHVWVEKPLSLTAKDLEKIEATHRAHPQVLMVGFNRRFSPYLQPLRDKLAEVRGPKQIMIRVNAGKLDDANWQSGAEGGGRLLGEACHFTDLALYLAGSPVQSVTATAGKGQDCYSITLRHRDGSLSVILYTSENHPQAPKEMVSVSGGGNSGVMTNYKTTLWNGRTLKCRGFFGSADKGHAAALQAFADACRGRAPVPVPVAELLHSSHVILAAAESVKTGQPVLLSI
ncbi:MAG TPA: bi-domain-containing oxidoreductase [Alphaproteobacteria bacterium]|nr:bi-domain-containing oxidoreductase [Alphaproteobacteria bacterium]